MAADDPLKERFEILRRRARQAATGATQREQEGLRRRFAQLGQVGAGAQIRAEAQAAERGAKRLQQAEETVGLAELGERQRIKEAQEAREFARGEREAGQSFAAEQAGVGRTFAAEQAGIGREFAATEAGKQRTFMTGEREAVQLFQSGEAELQRKFITGERISAQDFAKAEARLGRRFSKEERLAAQKFADKQAKAAQNFQRLQNNLTRAFQLKAFREGIRQFELQFDRDTETIEFNKDMANANASKTLLDDLGLGQIGGFYSDLSKDFQEMFS